MKTVGGLRPEINDGLPVREAITFQGLIDRYISEEIERGDLAHITKEPDLNRINKHISPKWGMSLLPEIKPYAVQQWLRTLAVAPKTKSHIRGLMYRLFEKAMLLELIPLERNPMCLVELKGVSKRKKSPRILTVEEFGALLKELVHPYRCMVLLAGCIGLRISEVLGLCWTGIKFETLCMEIREGFARSQVTKLKSEYSQDEMPLDPDVATILLEWKQLPTDERRLGLPEPADRETLRFWLAAQEGTQNRGTTSEDFGSDRLAHSTSQLPRLARRDWRSAGRAAETHASRQYFDHDEHLRRSLHESEAQSQHLRRAAPCCFKITPDKKDRLVDGLDSYFPKLTGPFRTTIENPNSS